VKMADNFDQLLDKCLDRIAAGEEIDSVLSDYPSDAARLRPLLQTMVRMKQANDFIPGTEAKRAALQRFNTTIAIERESRRSKHTWSIRTVLRPATIAIAATIVVVLVVVFTGVKTALSPGPYIVVPITPVTDGSGNFAFLVSDEVNAITDFSSAVVNISKIGLQQPDGKWVEITPTISSIDLTQLPGDAAQIIWQGDIPFGNYNQVFIYVDNITGKLKTSEKTPDIKLPSQKLHMAIPFEASNDTVTSFTYDMTIIAAGNGHNIKYILKPQIGDSGVQKEPRAQPGKTGENNSTIPEQFPVSNNHATPKPPKK
jgi:hypothetical protein